MTLGRALDGVGRIFVATAVSAALVLQICAAVGDQHPVDDARVGDYRALFGLRVEY